MAPMSQGHSSSTSAILVVGLFAYGPYSAYGVLEHSLLMFLVAAQMYFRIPTICAIFPCRPYGVESTVPQAPRVQDIPIPIAAHLVGLSNGTVQAAPPSRPFRLALGRPREDATCR